MLSLAPVTASANTWFNPISFIPGADDTISKWDTIANQINDTIEWFKHIRENIAHLSIDFMTWSFDAITKVVLHTPTMLFDSQWFSSNILLFTGLSIGMSIVLAMVEGFKRMFNKPHTDMERVSRRLPFVILGAGLAPIGFSFAFNLINQFTDMIIDIGRAQMSDGIKEFEFSETTLLEMLAFIGFDIALIGMMVPVFLQNFRRWFDLLALGVMTPLALSCWMFKAHEHHFNNWWEHIKKCSMVQLVYAVFLLIIGSLMFGAKEPNNEMEVMIKMGIVIGGLWRMNNPPNMLRRYLDTGTDVTGMWKGASNSITPHPWLKKAFKVLKRKPKPTTP